jgi:hypothetical protein
VRRYATQTQSYKDFYSSQASGVKSDALEYHDKRDSEDSDDDDSNSRSNALEYHDEESDQDNFDASYLCRLRKREIIDSIGQLAKPQSKLHDLVQEYREVDEEERNYDSDENSWGESNEDDQSDDYSNDENDQSDTDQTDDDQDYNARDEKN